MPQFQNPSWPCDECAGSLLFLCATLENRGREVPGDEAKYSAYPSVMCMHAQRCRQQNVLICMHASVIGIEQSCTQYIIGCFLLLYFFKRTIATILHLLFLLNQYYRHQFYLPPPSACSQGGQLHNIWIAVLPCD